MRSASLALLLRLFLRRLLCLRAGLASALVYRDGDIPLDALHVRAASAGACLLDLLVCLLLTWHCRFVGLDRWWHRFRDFNVCQNEATDQGDGCNGKCDR